MADTYGVAPTDVSGELAGLFSLGFTAATVPSLAQVTGWIATADALITLHVRNSTGTAPQASDAAATFAKRYIIEWTKAQVMRTVYAGNTPEQVQSAAGQYDDLAKQMKDAITQLGALAVGEARAEPRVQVPYTTTTPRELAVDDGDLDWASGRVRRF